MSLGTKNLQRQNAERCKEHLRAKYPGQRELVEEFILEIEGPEHQQDLTAWSQFTDTRRITSEMLQRVEECFARWLGGAQ